MNIQKPHHGMGMNRMTSPRQRSSRRHLRTHPANPQPERQEHEQSKLQTCSTPSLSLGRPGILAVGHVFIPASGRVSLTPRIHWLTGQIRILAAIPLCRRSEAAFRKELIELILLIPVFLSRLRAGSPTQFPSESQSSAAHISSAGSTFTAAKAFPGLADSRDSSRKNVRTKGHITSPQTQQST